MVRNRILAVIVALMVIGLNLTGCGSTEASEAIKNVIIVAGNHGNSMQQSYESIYDSLKSVAKSYGNVCVIVPESEPFVALNKAIPAQKKGMSSSKYNTIAERQATEIISFLSTSKDCIAKNPEVNMLKTFELISRIYQSSTYQEGRTEIYVFDTGLSTEGIDFRAMANNLDEFVAYTADYVKDNKLAVELNDANVTWYGLCDTDKPQSELSKKQKLVVCEVWEEYLNGCGINSLTFMTDVSTESCKAVMPSVSLVDVIEDTQLFAESFDEKTLTFKEPIRLTEEKIKFLPSSANIRDMDSATVVLEDLIDILRNNDSLELLIIGTTAKYGDLEGCLTLSEGRANTIRSILVSNGIEDTRVHIKGMGYISPFYEEDVDSEGKLIEAKAQNNRAIIILDYNSELAAELLGNDIG